MLHQNRLYQIKYLGLIALSSLGFWGAAQVHAEDKGITKATLGQALFFDTRFSVKGTMSCSTCHDPQKGFSDHRKNRGDMMVSLGDDGHSLGNRNAPTASYAVFSPKFHWDEKKKEYVGGQFWDGRAATLTDQAEGPPTNPVEMAMPDKKSVVDRLKEVEFYKKAFIKLYGPNVWNSVDGAYRAMADSIEAFERTPYFSTFDSKYDRYLKGDYELTIEEDLGRTLFFSNNNVSCANCHLISRTFEDPHETFTNFEYRNIGVPKNEKLLALGHLPKDYIDTGLAQNPMVKDKAAQRGKFKVTSLRNVAVTGPYMHNGVFKHLRTVVEFYNKYNDPTDNINPETGKPWGDPEVKENLALKDLKAVALTQEKIDALVAFLETLTDKRFEPLLEKIKKEQAADVARERQLVIDHQKKQEKKKTTPSF